MKICFAHNFGQFILKFSGGGFSGSKWAFAIEFTVEASSFSVYVNSCLFIISHYADCVSAMWIQKHAVANRRLYYLFFYEKYYYSDSDI